MKIRTSALRFAWAIIFSLVPNPAKAQAVGVPIENDDIFIEDAPLVAKATALKQAGKLLNIKQIKAALKSPKPAPLTLPTPSTHRLEPRVVAELGRKALVRVGWFYREKETKEWHVNLAAGYAITTDGAVATCHHCVAPEEQEMIEGFLIASDVSGNILPVTAVLAQDQEMDVAILRVEGGDFTPLPLNDQTAPGDTVYVFSDPMGNAGYFSSGMLNRFFWFDGRRSTNSASIDGMRNLRIHVSADWAPGSSGAALMDVCGNAIGHVSAIGRHLHELEAQQTPPETLVARSRRGRSPRLWSASRLQEHRPVRQDRLRHIFPSQARRMRSIMPSGMFTRAAHRFPATLLERSHSISGVNARLRMKTES